MTLKLIYYPSEKEQTTTQKTRTSNLNPIKNRVNSGVSEGLAVPAPLVTPVVLPLNDRNIIC